MAWTQTDVDLLKAAIAKGVRTVRNSNGEMVEYQSMTDMRKALSVMEDEVNGAQRHTYTAFYPTTSRGL